VGRTYRLTAPRIPEWSIQRAVASALAIEIAPPGKVSRHGVVWWSIDHANYAGEVPGARIGRGIIAGIPDCFVLWRGTSHFIELKAADGEMSDRQQEVASAVLAAGGRMGVARTTQEVLACIDVWGIPRAKRIREAA
jgi:hypothetical protein